MKEETETNTTQSIFKSISPYQVDVIINGVRFSENDPVGTIKKIEPIYVAYGYCICGELVEDHDSITLGCSESGCKEMIVGRTVRKYRFEIELDGKPYID